MLARLISLKIPPGARISIDKLARELGASQTPIRAALIRLEAEGLIVKTHLIGYSATAIPSAQRFGEIFQVRSISVENGRATGVEIHEGGGPRHIAAGREVLLCAGAIHSPQTG